MLANYKRPWFRFQKYDEEKSLDVISESLEPKLPTVLIAITLGYLKAQCECCGEYQVQVEQGGNWWTFKYGDEFICNECSAIPCHVHPETGVYRDECQRMAFLFNRCNNCSKLHLGLFGTCGSCIRWFDKLMAK